MNAKQNKKRFQVWKALGNGPYHYVASYQTREKAEQAAGFYRQQVGAVHGEPFNTYVQEKEH
jgi:hypothetical protein